MHALHDVSVLVLSRDTHRAHAIALALGRAGASARVVTSPTDALPALLLESFHVVACDLDLPNRWSALEWIATVRGMPYRQVASVRAIAFGDPSSAPMTGPELTAEGGFDAVVLSTLATDVVAQVRAALTARAA